MPDDFSHYAVCDRPAPHTPAQHLDKAIAHLHHAADMRLGWLRDIDLAQAARHLRAAGRDDLATRVENDGEDAVLAELWRAEREQVQW